MAHNPQRILLAYSIALTLIGSPLIFYGDEVAKKNDAAFFAEQVAHSGLHDTRYLVRGRMEWEKIEEELSDESVRLSVVVLSPSSSTKLTLFVSVLCCFGLFEKSHSPLHLVFSMAFVTCFVCVARVDNCLRKANFAFCMSGILFMFFLFPLSFFFFNCFHDLNLIYFCTFL